MKKILAILPVSIGGRLTTSSIVDGFRQNGFETVVFDELKNEDFSNFLSNDYDFITGYDFSPIKLYSYFDNILIILFLFAMIFASFIFSLKLIPKFNFFKLCNSP